MLPSWVSFWCYQQMLWLDWKVIARYKHSSLFGLVFCNKEKSFITLTPDRRPNGDDRRRRPQRRGPLQGQRHAHPDSHLVQGEKHGRKALPPWPGNPHWKGRLEKLIFVLKVQAGNTNWMGRLSIVDLLIKVACFVTKGNNIFNILNGLI